MLQPEERAGREVMAVAVLLEELRVGPGSGCGIKFRLFCRMGCRSVSLSSW